MKRIDHFLKYFKRTLKEKGLVSSSLNRQGFIEIETSIKEYDDERFSCLEDVINTIAIKHNIGGVCFEDVLEKYDEHLNHRLRMWTYITLINFLKEKGILEAFHHNVAASKNVDTIRDYVMKLPFTYNPRKMIISAFLWGFGETPIGVEWSHIHRQWVKLLYEEYNKEIH